MYSHLGPAFEHLHRTMLLSASAGFAVVKVAAVVSSARCLPRSRGKPLLLTGLVADLVADLISVLGLPWGDLTSNVARIITWSLVLTGALTIGSPVDPSPQRNQGERLV